MTAEDPDPLQSVKSTTYPLASIHQPEARAVRLPNPEDLQDLGAPTYKSLSEKTCRLQLTIKAHGVPGWTFQIETILNHLNPKNNDV